MKRKMTSKTIFLILTMALLLNSLSSCAFFTNTKVSAETIEGYIMDVHCFVKKPVPESDTKTCLQMAGCAASGFGVAVKQDDGSYKFYFLDGTFAPAAADGQLKAMNLINNTTKKDHIYISVTGSLTGKSIKYEKNGVSYPVFKISSISESNE
ncbi:MAG: hypothetical protein ACYCYI_01145 [Saccharofermentanales bacterium]